MDGLKNFAVGSTCENGQVKRISRLLFQLIITVFLILSIGNYFLGCRTLPPQPATPAIAYDLAEDVEVTKVSFYMKKPRDLAQPVCWVDVGIKNLGKSEQGFLVLVQVDDEPGVAMRTSKPVGPKKEETVSLITLGKSLPTRLAVVVSH
jgi:hypothetical protein